MASDTLARLEEAAVKAGDELARGIYDAGTSLEFSEAAKAHVQAPAAERLPALLAAAREEGLRGRQEVMNPAWGAEQRDPETSSLWKFWDVWLLKEPGKPLPALAPCPFCGGEGWVSRTLRGGCLDGEPDAWAYSVHCRCCAAAGPWCKSSEHGAVVDWNRRVGSLPPVEPVGEARARGR
jgi:hypothetical protein